jgi:hypothetical protein
MNASGGQIGGEATGVIGLRFGDGGPGFEYADLHVGGGHETVLRDGEQSADESAFIVEYDVVGATFEKFFGGEAAEAGFVLKVWANAWGRQGEGAIDVCGEEWGRALSFWLLVIAWIGDFVAGSEWKGTAGEGECEGERLAMQAEEAMFHTDAL